MMNELEKSKLALPGKPCAVQALPDWTEQEKWAWKEICEGRVANFNASRSYGGSLDPKTDSSHWSSRELRAEFLETILLHEPFRSAITRRGVQIAGAFFKVPIDMSCARLTRSLTLYACRFESDLNLSYLISDQIIVFDHCVFLKQVNLLRARIHNDLLMSNVFVEATLDLTRIVIKGALFLQNATLHEVSMRTAQIDGQLNLIGSKVNGSLHMDSMDIGSDLFMSAEGEYHDVNLVGANISGTGDMSGSQFNGIVSLNGSRVGNCLFLRYGSEFSDLNLVTVEIGGQVDMERSTFRGAVDMSGLKIKGALLMGGEVNT